MILPLDIVKEIMIRSSPQFIIYLNQSTYKLYNDTSFWLDCFYYHQLPIPFKTIICMKSYVAMKKSKAIAIKWKNYINTYEEFSRFYPYHCPWTYRILEDPNLIKDIPLKREDGCYIEFTKDELLVSYTISKENKTVFPLTDKQFIDHITLIIDHYDDDLAFLSEMTYPNKSITIKQLI